MEDRRKVISARIILRETDNAERGSKDDYLKTFLKVRTIFHIATICILCIVGNAFSQFVVDFSVECGSGFTDLIHQKGQTKVQSVLQDTVSECQRLYTHGYELKADGNYRAENDTFRLYIEKCAQQSGSFHQFSALSGAVQFMSDVDSRWLEYRDWLKKVLYLNLDTIYYCTDVSSILTSFQCFRHGQGIDNNGEVAIIDFLLQNNRCPENKLALIDFRKNIRNKQVQIWRDTVGPDSAHKPLDTSAVTLESLDLQILRGPQFAVAPSPSGTKGNTILSFIATKNPFTDATMLRYELNDASALRLEIYDVLGRQVYSEGEGMKEAGRYQIQLDGKLFSSGTYYARLITLGGEVKTITLKHF